MSGEFRTLIIVALSAITVLFMTGGTAVAEISVVDSEGTINGSVAYGPMTWNASNFPAFSSEVLTVLQPDLSSSQRTINLDELFYNTTEQMIPYKVYSEKGLTVPYALDASGMKVPGGGGYYGKIGWFGKPYIAMNGKPNKLSTLVLEQNTTDFKILNINETWNMGDGYNLTLGGVDIHALPKQALLVLSNESGKLDDKVIQEGEVYTYYAGSLAGESNIPLFVTYVDNISVDSITLRYTWLISTSFTEVSTSGTYGVFKVTDEGTGTDHTIKLWNDVSRVTLSSGSTVNLFDGLYFVVNDSASLAYYPMMTESSGGGGGSAGGGVGGGGGGGIGLRGAISDETNKIYRWDARNFPGFWYDLDSGFLSEELRIDPRENLTASDRTIDLDHLWYNTTMELHLYKAVEANYTLLVNGGLDYSGNKVSEGCCYAVIGWQGVKYVAVNGKANKLSQLVIEQGEGAYDKKTLAKGETWDMGGGYNLTIIGIDANAFPRQVQFNLSLNGIELAEDVASQGELYTYTGSLGGENDVPIFVTYFDSIFAGTASDFVQLRYTWLISTNVTEVKTSDTYGVFKVVDDGTGADRTIKLWSDNGSVNLSSNSTVNIMGNFKFSVADNDSFLRFYPYAEVTVPDVYEVRGEVYDGQATGYIPYTRDGTPGWDAFNFAGFWFDPKDGKMSEKMIIRSDNNIALNYGSRTIPKDELFYNSTMQVIQYKANEANSTNNFVDRGLDSSGTKVSSGGQGTSYGELGWLGEPYVALNGKPNKLSRLVIEQGRSPSDMRVLGVGDAWEIGDGWTLTATSIDAVAKQARLVLNKSGVNKDDVNLSQGQVYTYVENSIAGESDVPLFVTYVDSVFPGASSDMVALRYTWAISTNVTEIRLGDTYGVFKLLDDGSGTGTIKLWNDETSVSLWTDSIVELAGGMKFRVADNDSILRFYPFIIKTSKISPPIIEITSPSNNSSFLQGEMIMLSGSASTGSGIYNFSWTSSIDGFLGNTSRIPTFTLSPGKHTITLTVMDANGLANSTSITITVLQSVTTDVPGEVYDASGHFPHTGTGQTGWDALNFAGFWSDTGMWGENLTLTDAANSSLIAGSRTIDKDTLFYNSTMQLFQYAANEADANNKIDFGLMSDGYKAPGNFGTHYGKIGWLGRPYIALNGKPNKLAALIVEQNISEEKILNISETWYIGQGYAITLKDIDTKSYPRQVLLVFSKDGIEKDNRVISHGQVYTYVEKWISGESDVPTFVTFIDNVTSTSVKLKYTWAVSSSVIEIRAGDTYGVFMVTYDGSGTDHTIKLWNDKGSISLSRGSTVTLFDGLHFVVNDSTSLAYYPMMTEAGPPGPTIPSSLSILLNNGDAYTNSTNVTLSISAVNATEMSFSNDSITWSTWEPFATISFWNLIVGDGSKTVYFKAKNAGGEASPVKDKIILDTTPPSVIITSPANGTIYNTTNVTVRGTATDSSGLKVGCFEQSGGGGASAGCGGLTGNTSIAFVYNITLREGENFIKVLYIDVANNSGSASVNLTLETPTPTPTPTPGGATPTPTPTPQPGVNMSWRFISVPFLLDNSSVNNVLAGIDYDMLSAWDPVQKIWTAPVMNLEPLQGYLIHMNTSQQITNLVQKSGPSEPHSMDVFKGWNLIGTRGNKSQDAETMLGPIDDSYFSIWNWNVSQQMYDEVGINGRNGVLTPSIVGTDTFTMQPVVSYWVWVTQNNTLLTFSP